MNILVVENSPEDREHLKFLLNLGGHFELFNVDSISKAFKLLGVDGNKDMLSKSYDLIILDIFMDGMNGIAACEKIKSVQHLKDIPLIVVTETLSMENMLMAFEAGVSDYISKPLENKIELIPRVNSAIRGTSPRSSRGPCPRRTGGDGDGIHPDSAAECPPKPLRRRGGALWTHFRSMAIPRPARALRRGQPRPRAMSRGPHE